MQLTVLEIMVWGNISPKKGNFVELLVLRSIEQKMDLTEEDRKACGFYMEENERGKSAKWKDDDYTKDVDLTKEDIATISNHLDSLSKSNDLPIEAMTLYEKVHAYLSQGGKKEDEETT